MRQGRRLTLALTAGALLWGATAAMVPGTVEAGGPRTGGHRGQLGVARGHHLRPIVNPFYPPPGQGIHVAPYSVMPPTTIHVAPHVRRSVPGHWAQVWVPTFASVEVWVPAHYAQGGVLVPGQWTSQTVESGGYYETVWVNGQ